MRKTTKGNLALLASLFAIGAVLGEAWSTAGQKAPPAPKTAPLVSITISRTMDVPIELSAQGHLVALNLIEVRPQMTGIIRSVHFKEGEQVRAGQLLFTLDDSDTLALLRRSEALAAQIKAQLADARRDLQRSRELVASRFIAPSAIDTATSKADALQAQLDAASAEVDSARVALAHTRISSPISAKSGALAVHPGSLAQTSAAAPLVTLAQFDPIGVEFNLPEANLQAILAARGAANGPVSVSIDGLAGQPVAGKLSFINNTVNTSTGTIALKADFANPALALWPGAFVRVTVHAGRNPAAVVLPPQAVMEGPAGRFVYLLGAGDKVVARPVTLLRVQDTLAVVDGLASGQRVVLEGGQNLKQGMAVRIAPETHAAAAVPVAANAGSNGKAAQ
ncbi:efflux RND transporter periplasmic adaptor subunit [Janthinobacterium sp. PAMC25594]|uniref:efflux RND transporter periplasmic adaptor subunit n=1 Tax=Janthinobacterium sp. PAMC25594 TaxID=2861284 RepID=UPI001C62E96A|nr:efflux RND transporter periplasmic adaptor subunit [Janthinobacterium sp. PAMC25594]QYG08895.1 efflux RND transporter periplasmic adaptor subunit [Janthinobacterium sp. PAMC25594]